MDPRIAQTRELVLRATYELIAEVGFADASVERIAERSGVARSSIYRHWRNPVPTLHMEALAPLTDRPEDAAPTGDLQTDLLAYLSHVADRLNDPLNSGVQLALLTVADTDSAYAAAHRKQLAVRTKVLRDILQAGVDAGSLCTCIDIDLEAKLLLSPLTYVRFVEHLPVEPDIAPVVIAALLTRGDPQSPSHTHAAAQKIHRRKSARRGP